MVFKNYYKKQFFKIVFENSYEIDPNLLTSQESMF